MLKIIRKWPPGRIIALGFILAILIGSGLLMLPCSIRPGQTVSYIDALFTSTSAVCVTGLLTVDTGTAFTPVGQGIIALLIQIGGLGVSSVGAAVILAMGKKMSLKSRNLVQEGSNLGSGKGAIRFVKSVFLTTVTIELIGAAISFTVFIRDHSFWPALGYSLFHAIASFNNAGFDNLGHSGTIHSNENLFAYHDNVTMNLVTTGLIILGGIGFLVIREICTHKWHWKRYSMQAKVVITTSAVLIGVGTVLLKLTAGAGETWLGAYFHSVSARTAGFSTVNMGLYSHGALLVMMVLMFIGSSPGSTGGGIKTSTFFVLLQAVKSAATNQSEKAFHYAVPANAFRKAAVITLLALALILLSTFLLLILEPGIGLTDALFEMTSAAATVGLSTGITPTLGLPAKLLTVLVMYIGRLGPLTVASMWYFNKGERTKYPDGNIAIG